MKNNLFNCLIISLLTISFGYSQAKQLDVDSIPSSEVSISQLSNIFRLMKVEKGDYQIQLGFGSLAEMERLKERYNALFAEDTIFHQKHPLKVSFNSPTYRLRLEHFRTRLETEKASKRLRPYFRGIMILEPGKNN
ncbi:MAG: SPOR domain-containing protein [Flavobacteriaceae bacterium]